MIQELLLEAVRVLFLQGIPLILIVAFAGTIVSAIQTVTALHEPSLSYAIRVLTIIATMYFLLPGMISSIVELAKLAWH